jgi:hypothetical protein
MTKQLRFAAAASLIWIPLTLGASAQEQEHPASATAASVVPQQVRYAGKLAVRAGQTVQAEFRIYAAAEGGEALWTETQQFPIAADGSYSILLGNSTTAGLPQSVFAGGAARWLGISVERGQEQERILLSSVPYAMKSADAESLSGHAASDFVTQEQLATLAAQSSLPTSASEPTDQSAPTIFHGLTSGPLTGSGTANSIPLWTGTYTQGNSVMTQNSGTIDVQGPLAMPPVSQATTSNGQQSEPIQMNASAWNTVDAAADNQSYSWVVGANGNNTATPSGTLYLQYQSGTGPKTNILKFLNTGQIAFAPTQTFPGTLASVTGVGSINTSTSAGAVTVALNVPTLELQLNGLYPRLSVANSFTGNQSITGGLTITGALSTGSSLVSGLSTSTGGFLSNSTLNVKPAGVATSGAAINSPMFELGASAYSSSSAAAVAQNFAWQTDATGNNTTSPSANLALLFGSGTSAPMATGLSIAPNGNINFSPTQTFPIKGTGGGTITGITTSSPLTGSGTTGSIALGLNESTLTSDITPALENTFNNIYAQLGATNIFTSDQIIQGGLSVFQGSGISASGTSSTNPILYVSNAAQSGAGIYATAASNGYGIEGNGQQTAGSIGVLGILGGDTSFSFTQLNSNDGINAGIWADGSNGQESAFVASADNINAGFFFNDSSTSSTILVENGSSGGPTGNIAGGISTVLRASGPGGTCGINQTGNLSCTGQVKTLVSTNDGARQLETYSVQSSENWVEDYGSGQLQNGSATIQIEPAFAQTVNTGVEFHVFLTPGGDCKGLYVTNKTNGSFEVHELGGGASTIPFDYKIVAKRSGMEAQRLVDVTERMHAESEAARLKPLDHPLPHNRLVQPRPAASSTVTRKQ